MMKRLCLVMIVRNESKVIRRCLERVAPYIDYWCIVDTGSDDNTKEIICDVLKNIPGELHQREWINFGVNRTQSLQLAKGKADYLLLCDADEQIIFSENFSADDLHQDVYLLQYLGDTDYSVPYLLKGDLNWFYVGVTHEYLDCDRKVEREKIQTLSILDLKDGGFKANKFIRDIALLEQGLKDEPNNSRYKFYLANSYRDNGQFEKATEWYLKRIADGGWKEEVTCSYEYLGNCYKQLNDEKSAMYYWLLGYDYNPQRIECLYNAINLLRINGQSRLAYQLGVIAKNVAYPENDILFVKKSVYKFWIYYELSISAYYANDFALGYQCCKYILFANPAVNIEDITVNNLQFYQQQAKEDSCSEVEKLILRLENIAQRNSSNKANEILKYLRGDF
ncbi:glycosyltransferase [Testudinibacter sp. TR-2022]|uniref:tetratricopeptide repeat-containing glycosyltransferase n=2 Tax=Testudinibacter sp. TR-2022 TaxID=2585029 RepID=UPI00111A81CE|nr:glycosyltransferase [Testudinibacter sp. TR-2022]TNH00690.1 glycosyltransferase [Pasteurellaceae bacterium Phil31]TNH10497.1 glycosyltransferase [Testudinibacter sp. TR-2022]TNH16527.1 glycosyltransferase [Testudinibacter sp. TR-2022]